MRITIRNPKDFWSGLMFLAFGLTFAWIAQTYQIGTARRMGPAFFPLVLALILAGIGAVVTIRSFFADGERIGKWAIKGLVLVLLSAISFGFLVRGAGLAVAVAVLVLISALASIHFKWRNTILMMSILVIFCISVFIYGLGLPIPVIGAWLGR